MELTDTIYFPSAGTSNSNFPDLSETATLTREESLAFKREAVADSMGCRASLLILPLIREGLFCARTGKEKRTIKNAVKRLIFFMIVVLLLVWYLYLIITIQKSVLCIT